MLIQLTDDQLAELSELTADNDHCEAYIQASQWLALPDLADTFKRIQTIKMRQQGLNDARYHERHQAYEKLMAYAKANMAKADYDRFYMCF